MDPDGSMAMVCYKNGSLTRQHFRDLHAGGSWDEFNALLQKAPIGTSPTHSHAVVRDNQVNDITRTREQRQDRLLLQGD